MLMLEKKKRGLPGIEPGTASTLKKNHTTRPKPLLNILSKFYIEKYLKIIFFKNANIFIKII